MEEGSERGGNRFRRANIVYFLSHNGAIEHPHLIRIHHLHNNGIHLRDVKRWLAKLRGKDMPDFFTWSYKRRYKSGYVWQDLKDDDLITPISDDEYVLKGSFLQFHSLEEFSCGKIDNKLENPSKEVAENATTTTTTEEHQEELDPKTSDIGRDSSNRRMAVFKIDATVTAAAATTMEQQQQEQNEQRYKKSDNYSHAFRNIFRCGADAKDSVLLPISRSGGGGQHRRRSTSDMPRQHKKSSEPENPRRNRSSSGGKRAGSASYKPVRAPDCSQCGRPFEPEKLHSHMQSCKALRRQGKGRTSVDKMPLRRRESQSKEDFSRESISGYLT